MKFHTQLATLPNYQTVIDSFMECLLHLYYDCYISMLFVNFMVIKMTYLCDNYAFYALCCILCLFCYFLSFATFRMVLISYMVYRFLMSLHVSGFFHILNSLFRYVLLYTRQNTDRMLKFDWLRAGPYACVRTGVWTG